jgi:transcriptional regulator with XRE-family HTH domain
MPGARVFGKRLQESRAGRGFSQAALARQAKLSREYISLLEHGHYDPTLTVLRKLAKALQTTVGKLVGE